RGDRGRRRHLQRAPGGGPAGRAAALPSPSAGTEQASMRIRTGWIAIAAACAAALAAVAEDRWVVYTAANGPGRGKSIVMLAGDEEYRSEEGLPMLAQILSRRHGFHCTVLFSQDEDGTIDPNNSSNVPGMELLDRADLVILQFRFRELPDTDMKH